MVIMNVGVNNGAAINGDKVLSTEERKPQYRDGVKLVVVSGITAIAAAFITATISKKHARQYLSLHGHEPKDIPESGTMLGLKALFYATVLTLGAFSIPIFGFCKYMDIKSMEDLRTTMRRLRKTSPPNPDERVEFENLSDFLNYINEKYGKSEDKKS